MCIRDSSYSHSHSHSHSLTLTLTLTLLLILALALTIAPFERKVPLIETQVRPEPVTCVETQVRPVSRENPGNTGQTHVWRHRSHVRFFVSTQRLLVAVLDLNS